MKKMLLLLAAIFLVCAAFTVPPVFAEGERDLQVFVNKNQVDFSGDVKPFINKEARTMVPIRFVSNELGASVEWDGDTQKVTIMLAGKTIELIIGDNFALVNGERRDFDTAAVIVEWDGIGRTMVPVRFISQTFGADVEWVGEIRRVNVTTESDEPLPPAVSTVTLYFSDDQAQHLVPEVREVALTSPRIAELIFHELLAGPRTTGLQRTIPKNTELRSLIIDQDVVYLSLSSHFRDEHWGGATGDQLTLYSIVNSLTKLPQISKVMFLLENTPREAILGHTYTLEPLEPNLNLIR